MIPRIASEIATMDAANLRGAGPDSIAWRTPHGAMPNGCLEDPAELPAACRLTTACSWMRMNSSRDSEGRFLSAKPGKKPFVPRLKLSTRERHIYLAKARATIVMKYRQGVAQGHHPIYVWMPGFVEEMKATVGRQVFEDLGRKMSISSRSILRWDSTLENEQDIQRLIDARGGRNRGRRLGQIVAQPEPPTNSSPAGTHPSTPGISDDPSQGFGSRHDAPEPGSGSKSNDKRIEPSEESHQGPTDSSNLPPSTPGADSSSAPDDEGAE